MIPGPELDDSARALLRAALGPRWMAKFEAQGVACLIEGYEEIVLSLETETCNHGPDGTRRTGDDWRFCCGISYEWLNDVWIRDAIEKVLAILPAAQAAGLREAVAGLDARLRRFYPATAVGPRWWREALPRNVMP